MQRTLLLSTLCIVLALPAGAEYYRYQDANGNLAFTDNLEAVPTPQRPQAEAAAAAEGPATRRRRYTGKMDQYARYKVAEGGGLVAEGVKGCREFLPNWRPGEWADWGEAALMAQTCGRSEILQQLTPAERQQVRTLRQQVEQHLATLPAERLERLREWLAEQDDFWEQYKDVRPAPDLGRLSPAELAAVQRQAEDVWSSMRAALLKNDLQRALGYFHPQYRDTYRANLEQAPALRQALAGEQMLAYDKASGETLAYHLIVKAPDGEKYVFRLEFCQDDSGAWKILKF